MIGCFLRSNDEFQGNVENKYILWKRAKYKMDLVVIILIRTIAFNFKLSSLINTFCSQCALKSTPQFEF